MKECINGIYIDMTAEEIAEIEKLREESEVFEEATEADYQTALAEMGVKLNG